MRLDLADSLKRLNLIVKNGDRSDENLLVAAKSIMALITAPAIVLQYYESLNNIHFMHESFISDIIWEYYGIRNRYNPFTWHLLKVIKQYDKKQFADVQFNKDFISVYCTMLDNINTLVTTETQVPIL